MDASLFLAFFLAVFGAGLAVELSLNRLNRREALRHPVLPARFTGPLFADSFSGPEGAQAYMRSRAYALERTAFDAFSLCYSAAITLGLLFSGILPWFARALAGIPSPDPLRGTLFLAGIFSLQSLLHLPPTLFATFRLEGKHGFNTMTWGLFWRDQLKGFILSALLGLPLIYAVLALMPLLGSRWWLWTFALIVAFQCALLIIFPVLIAPWFNRFRPLQDGELSDALFSLAARLRFPAGDIQVMDGSRRSLHSNAYFTGFGRFRRIVLYDTLLQQMERPELLGILAHEIGHYKRQHIRIMLAGQILMLGLLLFLASLALRWSPLYAAFGFASHSDAAGTATYHPGFAGDPAVGLFLFLTVFSSFSLLLSPLRNLLSRRHEYQADAFAVAAIQEADAMQTALIKLSRHNLANLTPHPWYSAFHYSHPTLSERLAAIQGVGEKLRGPVSRGARD